MNRLIAIAGVSLLAGCGGNGPAGPVTGDQAFMQCQACHSLEPGRVRTGPALDNLMARPTAGSPGYRYTPALRQLATTQPTWTPEALDRFLADPQGVAPGSAMTWRVASPEQRAAIIAYLREER